MKSFEPGVLERQTVPASLVRTARLLGEHKGRHAALVAHASPSLDRLRRAALLDSVISSSRLDSVCCPAPRVADLVDGRAMPINRAEQEIVGYRDALAAACAPPFSSDELSPTLILQLHARLFGLVPERGGTWKDSDNLVTETLADGSTAVRFTPVPAYATADAMARLHAGLASASRAGVDPLLLAATYLFDFLSIHPFADGNGRMMRLLASGLLRQAGYDIALFVSLDPLFEATHPACFEALQASWRGWHQGRHALAPWWSYFLGLLLRACEDFERHVAKTAAAPRGAKRDRVAEAIGRLPVEFRHVDLERLLPGVSRPTINRTLARLRDARQVCCVTPGRNARWRRILSG